MTPLERHAIEAAERCLAEARSALDREANAEFDRCIAEAVKRGADAHPTDL